MKLALLACSACALLMVACFAPVDEIEDGRRQGSVQFQMGDGFLFGPVEPGDQERAYGDYRYQVRWSEGEPPLAVLRLTMRGWYRTPRFDLEIIGEQRSDVPVGQRYLDESDFAGWTVEGTIDDQAYAGPATARSVHLDLGGSAVYVTLDVQLQPVDHPGRTYTGRIEGEGAHAFIPVSCTAFERPDEPPADPLQVEYCEGVKAIIAETPDDPDAPPPPWDPDGDVIDCTEGDDCGDPIPVPPPPG